MPPFQNAPQPCDASIFKTRHSQMFIADNHTCFMKTWQNENLWYYMGFRCIDTFEVTDWCSAQWKSEIWVDDIHWTCTNTLQLYWDLLSELTKAMLIAQRHTIYRERICFVVKQKVDLQMIQGREVKRSLGIILSRHRRGETNCNSTELPWWAGITQGCRGTVGKVQIYTALWASMDKPRINRAFW